MSVGIQEGSEILLPTYSIEYCHASWTMKFRLYLANEQMFFINS